MTKRRRFAVPPTSVGTRAQGTSDTPAVRKTPQHGGAGKRAPVTSRPPRTFAAPPSTPLLSETLAHGGSNNGWPRAPGLGYCACGGQHGAGEDGDRPVLVTVRRHAPDCLFAEWPSRVIVDVPLGTYQEADPERDADGYLLHSCPECGAFGKAFHTYQCPFWDRHADAIPF